MSRSRYRLIYGTTSVVETGLVIATAMLSRGGGTRVVGLIYAGKLINKTSTLAGICD
jgi:hypothetical protein